MNFKKINLLPRDIASKLAVAITNDPGHGVKRGGVDPAMIASYCIMTERYYEVRRPYLNVYPVVLECLLNTRPDIDPAMIPESMIHRLGVMEIRLPESSRMEPFFLGIMPAGLYLNRKERSVEVMYETQDADTDKRVLLKHSAGFGYLPEFGNVDMALPMSSDESEAVKRTLQLAFGIMLLAADSRYIEPVLLNRDRHRKLDDEGRKRAIDRSIRRGEHGFDLGKHLEVSPHFRRPHFAIRWTGKGRAVPRLVPVKGSVINKGLLGEVPTGYDG